jgi:hypothetical protein
LKARGGEELLLRSFDYGNLVGRQVVEFIDKLVNLAEACPFSNPTTVSPCFTRELKTSGTRGLQSCCEAARPDASRSMRAGPPAFPVTSGSTHLELKLTHRVLPKIY